MTRLDDAVADARERLVRRARRLGLASVGYDVLDSPIGPLWVAIGPRGVAAITYGGAATSADLRRLTRAYGPGLLPDRRRTAPLARELEQYFRGKRRTFDLDVDLTGLTEFQRRILRAISRVGYGDLTTYAKIAARAGNERAARAAGGACGSNPIPILIPCHRIVASDGTLGGYAGGLPTKRALLALERGGVVPAGGWPRSREATGPS